MTKGKGEGKGKGKGKGVRRRTRNCTTIELTTNRQKKTAIKARPLFCSAGTLSRFPFGGHLIHLGIKLVE